MRGILAIFAVWMLVLTPVKAEWVEARTDSFIVTGDAPRGTIRELALELERFRIFMGGLTRSGDNAEPIPVRVYLMGSEASFRELTGGEGFAGVFTHRIDAPLFVGNAEKTFGYSLVKGQGYDTMRWARQVIKHEYVHHYSYKTGPAYYPLWYAEGLADYLSTHRQTGSKAIMGDVPAATAFGLQTGSWQPWSQVFGSVRSWDTGERHWLTVGHVGMLYNQSWLATHYLRHSPERAAQLQTYLTAIREDPDNADANFEAAFGVDYEGMGEELKAYYEQNSFGRVRIESPDEARRPKVTLRRLDDWESRLAEAYARRFFVRRGADRRDLATELTALVDERPTEPEALIELGYLYYQLGDNDAAREVLLRLKAIDPSGSATLLLDGLTGPNEDAIALFDAARTADPHNALAHYHYAVRHTKEGTPTEKALDAALTCMELSPDRFEVQLTAGELLARLGYTDDARHVLTPIANWAPFPAHRREAEALLRLMDQ